MSSSQKICILSQLAIGEGGIIAGFSPSELEIEEFESEASHAISRLIDLGFCEGTPVRLLGAHPWGRDPLIIALHNSIVGLRLTDANHILIRVF